jgi:hypothetical protein
VANWTNIFYQTGLKTNDEVLKDNEIDVLMIQLIMIAMMWDLIVGYEMYPNNVAQRTNKYAWNFAKIIAGLYLGDVKFVTLFWISEYPSFIKNYIHMTNFQVDKIDVLIYQFSFFFFKVFYPLFLMWEIYQHKFQIHNSLLGLYFVESWFEICMFGKWTYDKITEKSQIKKD